MRMILYSLLLIVLMLTRPQGLFHRDERRRKRA
jgi:ABC-type branched-subunit amino acid transport system permease subunit